MSETLVKQRYRLLAFLGEGGTGKVWKAADIQTGAVVAVKKIHPSIARDATEFKRFEREVRLLGALNHPNIMRVLAFFEEWRRFYMVMPFLPGGSLYDRLQRVGPLPLAHVSMIGLGVARALKEAHRLGVVHRDIKPENILLDADDTPVLTDFSFARHCDDTPLTRAGFVVGSVSHLSPEECQGARADERSDIWRLGVVFYEMLAGFAPFERPALQETVTAILTEPLPPLAERRPDAPVELVYLVGAMLQKNPKQRIGSARQVATALKYIGTHTPGVSEPAA
ncbi:MAG: serine/threonine protein kinase [Anaerolineae bacterium]|nr:serine/threonine protein kinase [Anaerolineae bacterium]